jgi:hypothetical protein
MRTRWVGVLLLAGLPQQGVGQGRVPPVRTTNEYVGVINVTNVEGDGRESVIAYVTNGVVHCNDSYTDPRGAGASWAPACFTTLWGSFRKETCR